ncbi:MAG: OmpH family outer membrane protein [Aureispira sp.]
MKQTIALIFVLAASIAVAALVYVQIPKVAYVDAALLFEEFEGKKELEQRLEQVTRQQQQQLDSVQLQLKALEQAAQQDAALQTRWLQVQQYYNSLQQQQQADYYQKSQEYTTAIWKQINQYTQEYGEEYGYDYLLGQTGQHTVLYANKDKEVTQAVIAYINQKYAGN